MTLRLYFRYIIYPNVKVTVQRVLDVLQVTALVGLLGCLFSFLAGERLELDVETLRTKLMCM